MPFKFILAIRKSFIENLFGLLLLIVLSACAMQQSNFHKEDLMGI